MAVVGGWVTRQLGTLVGRAVLAAALMAAISLLLAPTAAGSPEGDADDAITAAWKDAGGDDSTLGAKHGDVYPVADGFVQNFAGGKMFFTPATGAKSLYGAILDKYEALGGPAGSDLGFPTINEVPGLAGPDSRVSTFSASDKPVIFWTPDRGAFVVRGAMNAAWDKLGSSGGALGVPISDETYLGQAATQPFSGGKVSWNRVTKVFTSSPPDLAQQLAGLQVPVDPTAAINLAWAAAGGAGGPLGAKQGGQYPIGDTGIAQNFAGGKVFFSPATGANALEGDILAKYESLGGPATGDLGFPTANEADGGIAPASRISTFSGPDNPVIFWARGHGAFVVRGAMKSAWDKLGGPKGKLGAPLGDQTVDGNVVSQKFTRGKVSWDRTKNAFSTEPGNLAPSLSGLQIPGQNQPSRAPAATGKRLTWHWWWLLVGVPVLLVAGMLALLALRYPRRRAAPPTTASEDADLHEPDDRTVADTYQPSLAEAQWSAGANDDAAASRFSAPDALDEPGWMHETGGGGLGAESASRSVPETAPGPTDFDQDLDEEDPDAVDTATTPIPMVSGVSTGRHAAADTDDDAPAQFAQPVVHAPAQLAIHLPMDDPYQVPDGYPVKANASFGLYYTPGSALYEDTLAEIWFVSEEAARANGFSKAG